MNKTSDLRFYLIFLYGVAKFGWLQLRLGWCILVPELHPVNRVRAVSMARPCGRLWLNLFLPDPNRPEARKASKAKGGSKFFASSKISKFFFIDLIIITRGVCGTRHSGLEWKYRFS